MRQRIIMCLCITQGETETWAENGRASIFLFPSFFGREGFRGLAFMDPPPYRSLAG